MTSWRPWCVVCGDRPVTCVPIAGPLIAVPLDASQSLEAEWGKEQWTRTGESWMRARVVNRFHLALSALVACGVGWSGVGIRRPRQPTRSRARRARSRRRGIHRRRRWHHRVATRAVWRPTRASSFAHRDPAAARQVIDLLRCAAPGRRRPDRGDGGDAAGGLVHDGNAGRRPSGRAQDDARGEARTPRPGPGRVQRALPRLRAVLGRRRARHGRLQGVDRRVRGGHRRRSGGRDPGAGRAGHHPLQHDDLRRGRLVQADGHRRRRHPSPRPARAPTSATRSSITPSTRSRPRPRARWSTSTERTAAGWAWERRRTGW